MNNNTNTFLHYLQGIGEFGIIREVKHPIVIAAGLPHIKPNEIVVFENGEQGEVFSIEKDSVKILVFSREPILSGAKVVRTNQFQNIIVGEGLLGSVIDPRGNSIFHTGKSVETPQVKEIEGPTVPMEKRLRITRPLLTGVSVIDLMVPLGKGQRELVIGDRKTGKTQFLLSTIKNQIHDNSIAIYAAIGKKKNDIRNIVEFFQKEQMLDNSIIVATSSHDSPSLIYLTPYSAMTIAEYYRDLGKDVLLILDDLSIHAKFYREIALLAGRFPGRDSYPGDIFYAHARLVERAGSFMHPEKKEVAITCLPVVEIVEGDLAGHIATNLMGMTDGHIFFDSNAYYQGQRPAVNILLSVTRVGRQAQTSLKRAINHELSAFLSQYEKIQNFSHFGAELSPKVKNILKTGEKMFAFFDQHYSILLPDEVQILMFALIWLHAFNDRNVDDLNNCRLGLLKAFNEGTHKEFFDSLKAVENYDNLLSFVSQRQAEILTMGGVPPQSPTAQPPPATQPAPEAAAAPVAQPK